ncbi:hypothetical protein Tco_0123308 [Tanacetum coccineum]
MIHPQSYQVIHPQLSQVTYQQASQASAISLQSSADPIQVDSSLVVPYFLQTDDPLKCLNKALTIMSTIPALSYPSSNNQLKTSSNLMHQVAMPKRQTLSYVGNCSTGNDHLARPYTQSKKIQCLKQQMLLAQLQEAGIQLSRDQLAILADIGERIDYGPGAFTLTTNALFQADKVKVYDSDCDDVPNAQPSFMANILSYGLDALAVVHNPDNVDNSMINQGMQVRPSSVQSSVVNHSETKITSDSNIIPYSQYMKELQQTTINLENKSVNDSLTAELERYKEQVKVLKEGQKVDFKSKDNISDSCEQSVKIDRLKQTLSKHLKEKESLMQTVTLLKNKFKKEESRNIYRVIAIEKKIKQLDNIVYKRDQSTQTKAQQLKPKLYDGNVIKNTSAIMILDSKKTLMLAEECRLKMLLKQQDLMVLEKKVNTTPVDYANSMNSLDLSPSCRPTKVGVLKELPKVSMVNTSLKKLKHHLAGFDVVVKERTTATAIIEGSWGFEHTKACFKDEIIPFVKALKDLFNTFDQYLIDELSEVQNVFHQMEQAEKDLVITTLKEELRKLEGKSVVTCRESVNNPKVIDPVLHKVDLEPLSLKLKNNRETHVDYIRITKENADTLLDIIEQARNSNPLDNVLAYACIHNLCVEQYLFEVNDRARAKAVKSIKMKEWKPTDQDCWFNGKLRQLYKGGVIETGIHIAGHGYEAKPPEKHLKEVKRIFYADYTGCKYTFKSTSGGTKFLGEKLVSWSSKKQDSMALLITEAEYVSLSACCAQVLWMRTHLTDYGFYFNKIPIYFDSKSAIAISCNPVQHLRTKHIAVRYHFINEHVENGTIELYFVKTDYQLADLFTKALPLDRFNYLVRHLGMRSLSPQ